MALGSSMGLALLVWVGGGLLKRVLYFFGNEPSLGQKSPILHPPPLFGIDSSLGRQSLLFVEYNQIKCQPTSVSFMIYIFKTRRQDLVLVTQRQAMDRGHFADSHRPRD